MSVWRVILEDTDTLAKKRLNAAEAYMERIADPIKSLKANKLQCMKKVLPQFTQIQQEVNQTVLEMTKAQKTYVLDETQANDARMKAKEAEEKLKKKYTGIFQSLAILQKTNAKFKKQVRFRPSYTKYRDVYNHKKNIIDPYDVQFDDDEEESIV